MGVIDELVRQERVQHDLDRGIGRGRLDQIGALDGNQILVRDRVERAQPSQRRKPHGRETCGFDGRHIPAGGLYVQNLGFLAEEIAQAGLERRVAAAVQHQLGIAAEEPGCIDMQRQVAVDAGFCAVLDEEGGLAINPAAFHRALRAASGRVPAARVGAAINHRRSGATTIRSASGGRRRRSRPVRPRPAAPERGMALPALQVSRHRCRRQGPARARSNAGAAAPVPGAAATRGPLSLPHPSVQQPLAERPLPARH
jgi:hypothetical protein